MLLLIIVLICCCFPGNLEAIIPCKPQSAADRLLANTVKVISLKILVVLLCFRTRSIPVEKTKCMKNMHLDYQHDYLQYGRKVVDDALV